MSLCHSMLLLCNNAIRSINDVTIITMMSLDHFIMPLYNYFFTHKYCAIRKNFKCSYIDGR